MHKTLDASNALKEGVDLLLGLKPMVLYQPRAMHVPGKLAQRRVLNVTSQMRRMILHTHVQIGVEDYVQTYFDAVIALFKPSPLDAEITLTNLFSFNKWRHKCENSSHHSRMMLWERREKIDASLAPHDFKLKRVVLRDSSVTRVNKI